MNEESKPCPFCGSHALYEGYHVIDGFHTPTMFCNSCKGMFFVEGSEDWVTDQSDGMEPLRIAWNRRVNLVYAKCKLPKETQERIEQMVHDEVSQQLKDIGIIRCKDCVYCERAYEDGAPICAFRSLHKFYTSLDDFCSHAESM